MELSMSIIRYFDFQSGSLARNRLQVFFPSQIYIYHYVLYIFVFVCLMHIGGLMEIGAVRGSVIIF